MQSSQDGNFFRAIKAAHLIGAAHLKPLAESNISSGTATGVCARFMHMAVIVIMAFLHAVYM